MEQYAGLERNPYPTYEHLKEGVKPLVTCVGTIEEFIDNPEIQLLYKTVLPLVGDNLDNVNYFGEVKELESHGFKTPSVDRSYAISPVDSKNKVSKGLVNCTGVVAIGLDSTTGETISFMSHENPRYFLDGNRAQVMDFINDLCDTLEEIKARSEKGTVDASIVGGNYFSDIDGRGRKPVSFARRYVSSIKLLSSKIEKVLGFRPTVITGPKTFVDPRGDMVYLDNNNRRIYLVRPQIGEKVGDKIIGNNTTSSYDPKNIDQEKEKWPNISWKDVLPKKE
ncbi:MAG: hypothetical protein WC797_01000 [Candidatus Paceibacterota bacterium]|jgi:hypothetical protein